MAMSRILLANTGSSLAVTGSAVQSVGYYGQANNLQTIAVYVDNFSGELYIQATLSMHPDRDVAVGINPWFAVPLSGTSAYLQFPLNPQAPTGITGDTGTLIYSFSGNYTFLRARMDQTYLPSGTSYGAINQILLNF